MKLDVFAHPKELTINSTRRAAAVVIDTLRMTSAAITAIHNNAREVIPVTEIDEAISLMQSTQAQNILLGGEREGEKISGFDLGNSPLEYTGETVSGKTVITTTTNGTAAIQSVKSADVVYICAILNISAIVQAVKGYENVIILCAGTEGKFSLEDCITAGGVIHGLMAIHGDDMHLNDLADVCMRLYRDGEDDLLSAITRSNHAQKLISLGYADDIEYCSRKDMYDIVPVYAEGRIRLLNEGSAEST